MSDADELDEKLAQARRELMQNPGVVGVGYGYKERGGALTQELSFRAYVREKKPLSALSPDEVVPPELLGIPTDVVPVRSSADFSCEILDSFSPLVGGIGISNLKAHPGGGSGGMPFGTIGCFATLNQSASRDNIVVLTNQHVLAADRGQVGDTLYQPRLERDGTGFKPLTRENEHPIGSIVNLGVKGERSFAYPGDPPPTSPPASTYYLDCGIAHVNTCYSSWCNTNCGVDFENRIMGLEVGGSSALEGIARIRNADLPPGGNYVVHKVGRTSGRTVGRVTDAAGTVHHNPTNTDRHNCVLVDHLGPNCEAGTRFSDEGDSGAVIVNGQRQVIALLFGGNPAGTDGHGCHIHPVLDVLGITLISTAHNPAGSATHTLLEALAVEGAGEATARAAALRHEIVWSKRGLMLHGLVERHRDEVVHLVNRVRGVTLAWHRAHGPDFLAHAVHASRNAGYAVPRELHGLEREAALERVIDAIERHGSPALRADLDLHAAALRALAEDTDDLETLAERLRTPQYAATAPGSP